MRNFPANSARASASFCPEAFSFSSRELRVTTSTLPSSEKATAPLSPTSAEKTLRMPSVQVTFPLPTYWNGSETVLSNRIAGIILKESTSNDVESLIMLQESPRSLMR